VRSLAACRFLQPLAASYSARRARTKSGGWGAVKRWPSKSCPGMCRNPSHPSADIHANTTAVKTSVSRRQEDRLPGDRPPEVQ